MKTELNYLNGYRHKPFQSLFEIRSLPYLLEKERERPRWQERLCEGAMVFKKITRHAKRQVKDDE